MDPIRSFSIDPALDQPEGGFRVHLATWKGVRVGVGHPRLDELRDRVLERVRAIAGRYREILEAPRLEEVAQMLYASGVSPWRWPPAPARHVQELIRNEAFPVLNDAADLARLFGLVELVPTYALDPAKLRGPFSLALGDAEMSPPRGSGPESVANIPVLRDGDRVLASLCHENARPEVSELSSELLLVLIEPWPTKAPLDLARAVRRLENWCQQLLNGKLDHVHTVGGPRRG